MTPPALRVVKPIFNPPNPDAVARALDMVLASAHEENDQSAVFSEDSINEARFIDQTVNVIQTCLKSLTDEANRRKATLYKRKNDLYAKPKLPVELQIGIFYEAATVEPHVDPTTRLAMLQKVSTLWWTIIREAPSLWRHVNVFRPSAEASLQRSGTLPLWVEISHRFGSPSTSAESACQLTAAQAHRWKAVTINSMVDYAFLTGLRGPFPMLEYANLTMVRPTRVIIPFRGGPQLKQLRLNDVPIEWEHMVLPSLEILVVENYTALPFQWAQILLKIMASSPRLRILQLNNIHSTTLAPTSGPSHRSQLISSLNTLHIKRVQPSILGTILSHIDGKRLTTLRILESVLPQTFPLRQSHSLVHQLIRNLSLPTIHLHILPERVVVSHTDVYPQDSKCRFLITPPETRRGQWPESAQSVNRFLATSNLSIPVQLNFVKPGGPLIEEMSNRIQEMTSLAIISFGPHISVREAIVILRLIHALPTEKVPNLKTIILGFSCEYEEGTSDFAKLMKLLPALMNTRPGVIVQDAEGNVYGPNVEIFLDAANPNYAGSE